MLACVDFKKNRKIIFKQYHSVDSKTRLLISVAREEASFTSHRILSHSITTVSFGFSRDIYWAVIARFLQGCSMGQLVVSKAILADVCDDSNMSMAVSVLVTGFEVCKFFL